MTEKALDRGPINGLIIILPLTLLLFFVYTFWPILGVLFVVNLLGALWQNFQWRRWIKKINPIFNSLIKENKGCLTVLDLSVKANITGNAAKRFLEYKVQEYGAQRKTYQNKGTVYYFLTASALGSILDDSEPLWELDEEDLEIQEDKPQDPVKLVPPPAQTPQNLDTTKVSEVEVQKEEPEPSTPEASVSTASTVPQTHQDLTPQSEEVSSELENTSISEIEVQPEPESHEENIVSQDSEPEEKDTSINAFVSKVAGLFDSAEPNLELSALIQADLAKRLDVHASTVGKHKLDKNFDEWSQSRDPDGVAWIYSKKKKMFIPQLERKN